jgi:hypothetical protein
MGKYISLGGYNKLYKYIWIYLILRFLTTYIFSNNFIFEQFKVESLKDFPDSYFITSQFNYLGFIVISPILIFISKFLNKKKVDEDFTEQKLIFNEQDIITEYGIQKTDTFWFINIFFLVLKDWIEELLWPFGCSMFTYWMFEMLYYELFHYRLFKTNIYRHHIFSFIFILVPCCLLKSIYIIIQFANDTDKAKFFDNRKWLIPTSLIVYFLFRIFKTYTYSNIKYYFDRRIISIPKFMFLYGIFGLITNFFGCIISTYVPCGDNALPELSKRICRFNENNQTIYYFDSYILYFEQFANEYWKERIVIIIFKTAFNFACFYNIYVIFKKLSPIYYLCFHRFNVLILNILTLLNKVINDRDNIDSIFISNSILDFLILIFYILGSLIYLEFIELNFYDLNFYTKRNIKERANSEKRISLGTISVNSDISEKEIGD